MNLKPFSPPFPMMKAFQPILIALLGLQASSPAQDDILLLRPEERQAVDRQTDEFNAALAPALADAARSTVRVWSGKYRLAYGTVVGDGRQILTKWSEVARAPGALRIEAAGEKVLAAKVTGVYPDEDLAIMEIVGETLTPVNWSTEVPPLGGFIAAPQPDGRPAAFGVVSVPERNLRDTDQAFLGVEAAPEFTGPGVKIARVTEDSGAANAGLRPGNIILKLNQRPISGLLELRNALVGVGPGTSVEVLVRVGKEEKTFDVVLGKRPPLPNFLGERLRQMERMGGPIRLGRDSCRRVIQTDMRPKPNHVGGPIGITMARADRTRSFVMPAAAIQELMKTEPVDPATAEIAKADPPPEVRFRRIAGEPRRAPRAEASPERLRQHLDGLQRLRDFMREEMESLERGR